MFYLGVALACLVALYAGILIFALLFGNRLMFARPQSTYVKTPEFDELKSQSGEKLAALFLEKKNAEFVVLYCHGNGEDLGMIRPLFEEYRDRLGVSVASFDYCGYGASEGKPTESCIYDGADALWKFLTQKKGFKPNNIILAGYSLGSAGATHLASKHPNARGIILMGGVAKGALTILPFNPIPWDILNNVKKWRSIKLPVLLIHGTYDFIVPLRNARAVFKAARDPKRAVFIRGCGHLDIPDYAPDIYWGEIKKFIKKPDYEKSSIVVV